MVRKNEPTPESKFQQAPVSTTDELVTSGEAKADRDRVAGEFKSTNTPLSEAELQKRRGKKWTRRTTRNITD
jgi:hypothetical protein